MSDLTSGAGSLKAGMESLSSSSGDLSNGVSVINQSAQAIASGVNTLDTAVNTKMTEEEQAAVAKQAASPGFCKRGSTVRSRNGHIQLYL